MAKRKAKRKAPPKPKRRRASPPVPAAPPPPDPVQVDKVWEWLVQGGSRHEITKAFREHFPAADPAPVFLEAAARLVHAARTDPELLRGWCIENLLRLKRSMEETGDFNNARQAVKDLYAIAIKDGGASGREKPYDDGMEVEVIEIED